MALLLVVGAGGTVLSCSSDESGAPLDSRDGASDADASEVDVGAGPSDAGSSDADAMTERDAAPFDGGPLPIACASKPCAKALVTTTPPVESLLAAEHVEGYCALLDDGTVACWGANANGQLGRGADGGTGDSARPMRVEGLSDVRQLDHTCAVDGDGGVWCWGTGAFLRNDAGASTTELTPIKLALPPAKRVAMSLDAACAVVDDGVVCWGRNTNGLLAPLDVSPVTANLPPAVRVPAEAPIRDLRLGKTAFAIREDGVTLSWGANPLLARISSLAPDPTPREIPLLGITSMDVTSSTACATVAGVGYCWGRARETVPVFERILPEPVAAPEPLVQIATTRTFLRAEFGGGIVSQPQRWCAVGASGAVYCWGYNEHGEAGDGTTNDALEPVKVQGLPALAVEVKALPTSTCALLTTGKVHCWGTNYYGQLGNGKLRVPSLVPQEVVLP